MTIENLSDIAALADRLTRYAALMEAGLFVENVGGFAADILQAAEILRELEDGE